MNTKNTKIGEGSSEQVQHAGKKRAQGWYHAFVYADENGGFYSYGKCGEMTGEITIISKRYASRENAEYDLKCHVADAHGINTKICWHQGTLEDVNRAKAGCGEPLLPVPIPPKPKFKQTITIEIEGDAEKMAIGWGTHQMLVDFITKNTATGTLADEVERWYQTSLKDRKITVKCN